MTPGSPSGILCQASGAILIDVALTVLLTAAWLLFGVPCAFADIPGGITAAGDTVTSGCDDVQVAVYYFPHWHNSHEESGEPVGEWKAIKSAVPHIKDHAQPKVPAWGYEDETDPGVMTRKIDAAADHGVDAFIFDWYYHGTGSYKGTYLEDALNKGYLKTPNRARVPFSIMWANHSLGTSPGGLSRDEFDTMTLHLLTSFLGHPAYWKVRGEPYFSIYEVGTFINGLGGADQARDALAAFEAKAKAAGLKGIHFNAIESQIRSTPPNDVTVLKAIGFESVTSYIWTHTVGFEKKPATDYEWFRRHYFRIFDEERPKYGLPYFPNVTMGWDPTPRLPAGFKYTAAGDYPNTPIIINNTPARFKKALEQARVRACSLPPEERILTINAWNEWGEGSYLEPDTINGMGYLEAIRDVFGAR